LQVDHALYGLEPAGHLLTHAALHALAAVLLFLALLRMTGALGPSAFVAAVFALHPLHVESVAWATERKDTLSGLFWMLGLLGYVRYAERPDSAVRYGWVALCLALGLLAKPTLVTFPFVLLLLDYWPLGRLRDDAALWPPEATRLRRVVLEKLPLFALAGVASVVAFSIQRARGAMAGADALAPWLRLLNALESYAVYLVQTVWPSGLAAFYPHPLDTVSGARAASAGLLLGVATALALAGARRRPYLAVGWLWYLGTLVPVIGVVQVGMQARADRYMYLPLVGLAILVAWGAADLAGRRRGLLRAAAFASLAALGLVATAQVRTWRDTTTLFERAIAVTEKNFFAHDGLAATHLREGRLDDAERHYRRARELNPHWASPHVGLADVAAQRGEPELAIRYYREGLRREPRARTHANMGKALADTGRLREAIAHYRTALEFDDDTGLAEIHALLGHALAETGELDEALAHYEAAVGVDPGFAEARGNLGILLVRSGRLDAAVPHLERAVARRPELATVHKALAEVASRRGRTAEAIRHYRDVLRLEPGSLEVANNLAWILATTADPALRDPAEALRLVGAVAAAFPEPPPTLLDTLAAAQAATGRFNAAMQTADAAVRGARALGNEALAAQVTARRALYAAGRPYVGPAPGPVE
jgi:tetratricopeptide (TPR) repeat protein